MTRSLIVVAAVALTMSAQQDTVIRSNTRLVEVHVAAWDTQGKRVTDLTKEDLQVFDDGNLRPVVSFTADGISLGDRSSAQRGNVESQKADEGDGYTVILLDWLNALTADRLRGDDAVRKVLSTIPVRQDVAVYALGTEPPNSEHPLVLLQSFGGTPADIASNIHDPLARPGPEMEDPTRRRTISPEMEMLDWNDRIMDTVRAFSDLAARMAHLPGRKSLMWLSTGFPETVDGRVVPGVKKGAEVLYLKEVNHILERFNRLNIAVHVIDTLGLGTGRDYPDTLKEVAERTGGSIFMDRNDLDTGVQVALEDMYSGYTLGFLVPEGTAAGLHRIQVRSSRRNVKLSYREAYDLTQ